MFVNFSFRSANRIPLNKMLIRLHSSSFFFSLKNFLALSGICSQTIMHMAAADLYWMHDPINAIKKINTKENLEENCKKKLKTTAF